MAMTPRMVTIDCADPQRLAAFWADAAGYQSVHDDPNFVVLAPPGGPEAGLALGFQRVPEPRAAKNRVHVDWQTEDRAAEVVRLEKLGAKVLGEETASGFNWTVLADPDGNEFCVAG